MKKIPDSEVNSVLDFLNYIHSETKANGFYNGSLAELAKLCKVKHIAEISSILQRNKIIERHGRVNKPRYRFCSTVNPSKEMSIRTITDFRKHRNAVARKWRDKKKNSEFGGVAQDIPTLTELREKLVERDKIKFQPKIAQPQKPMQPTLCLSDELFVLIRRIQMLTINEETISSETLNKVINQALDHNPALKKSYKQFILKSQWAR